MKTYIQIKTEHEEKYNEFKFMFWAFNKEDFNKGMEKLKLKKDDFKNIVSLGSGGYLLKTKKKEFYKLLENRQTELKEFFKTEKNLIDAMTYELINHEYIYNNDVSNALEALNLKSEELTDFEKICLKKAIEKSFKEAENFF